jgi:hypothetical protein
MPRAHQPVEVVGRGPRPAGGLLGDLLQGFERGHGQVLSFVFTPRARVRGVGG